MPARQFTRLIELPDSEAEHLQSAIAPVVMAARDAAAERLNEMGYTVDSLDLTEVLGVYMETLHGALHRLLDGRKLQ